MEIIKRDNRLPVIKTKRLVLRDIEIKDISPEYITWLNDQETIKFLEIRFNPQTPDKVEKYIIDKLQNIRTAHHFGIYDTDGTRLVGTVTLPVINWNHFFAEISFVLGHPAARGRGYATEAVHGVAYYMFHEKGIFKLCGGYYDGHRASARVFEKNCFSIEGTVKEKLLDYCNRRVDQVLVGLCVHDFKPNEALIGPLPADKMQNE